MKKLLTILLILAICFSHSSGLYAIAVDSVELSDLNEPVLDDAFLSSSEISKEGGNIIIRRENEEVSLNSQSNVSSGSIETVILVPGNGFSASDIMGNINGILLASPEGQKSESDFDSTLSAKIYTTIYYKRKVENGKNYVLLTKVSGGITSIDSAVTVVSQYLIYGCIDREATQKITQNPSGFQWSYSIPSTWKYVCEDEPLTTVGAYYEIEMRRGSPSTWTYGISNMLLNNMQPFP